MTYERAVMLLELKNNFTIEDLKKSYKRLIVKWHPDVNDDKRKAEEITKELNLAKQFLLDYLNKGNVKNTNTSNNWTTKNSNVSSYAYKQSLKLYDQFIGNYNYNHLKGIISNCYDSVFILIKDFLRVASSLYDTREVDNMLLVYKELINNEILKFIDSYCKIRGFKYEHNTKENVLVEERYNINTVNTLYNIYEKLLLVKKLNKDYEILIDSFVDEFYKAFLLNVNINYDYGPITNKTIHLFMKIIYDFKNHCLHLSSEDELYEMYSRTYYMLKSLRKDYAVKLCKYYKIEYSDVDNDYITIFDLKHSLDNNLLSLLSSIEAIKASEKFTNSIPESNDLNRKILTKNKK